MQQKEDSQMHLNHLPLTYIIQLYYNKGEGATVPYLVSILKCIIIIYLSWGTQ